VNQHHRQVVPRLPQALVKRQPVGRAGQAEVEHQQGVAPPPHPGQRLVGGGGGVGGVAGPLQVVLLERGGGGVVLDDQDRGLGIRGHGHLPRRRRAVWAAEWHNP
jgi:hypothetical protein